MVSLCAGQSQSQSHAAPKASHCRPPCRLQAQRRRPLPHRRWRSRLSLFTSAQRSHLRAPLRRCHQPLEVRHQVPPAHNSGPQRQSIRMLEHTCPIAPRPLLCCPHPRLLRSDAPRAGGAPQAGWACVLGGGAEAERALSGRVRLAIVASADGHPDRVDLSAILGHVVRRHCAALRAV